MTNEKLGIVFFSSQPGATRKTFDPYVFRRDVLDPLYSLLLDLPDVWQVLIVVPAHPDTEGSEVAWKEGTPPILWTPTCSAVTQYVGTWPERERSRIIAHSSVLEKMEDSLYDSVTFIHNLGSTRTFIVPLGKSFPTSRSVIQALIGACTPEPIMLA